MASVEKRKKLLINAAYFALVLGIFYVVMKYAFGLFLPFVIAFAVAALLQKPINKIIEKTPLKKGLISAVFVLLLVAAVVLLISFAGVKLVEQFKDLVKTLVSYADRIPEWIRDIEADLEKYIAYLPEAAQLSIHNFFDEIATSASESDVITDGTSAAIGIDFSWLATPLSGVWSTAKRIPSIFVTVIVSIFACCFMTSDYDRIVNFIKRQFPPEKRRTLSTTKRVLFSTMKKMLKAYILIICVTFVEMLIGLSILRLFGIFEGSYLVVISLIVAVVDIFPILGTGTILVPWGLISLISGDIGMGIGVLVIYAFISIMRQFIEPKLVAQNLGIPPVVTIIGMYFGLQLFGFIGMFIVPITIMILKYLNDTGAISIWKREEDKPEAPEPVSVKEKLARAVKKRGEAKEEPDVEKESK